MLIFLLYILAVFLLLMAYYGYQEDKKNQKTLKKFREATLSNINEIYNIYDDLKYARVEQSFSYLALLSGHIYLEESLSSPILAKKCVFYASEIWRESQHQESGTVYKKTVWKQEAFRHFYLQDDSAKILLRIDSEEAKNQIRAISQKTEEKPLQQLPEGLKLAPLPPQEKLLGYRYRETYLKPKKAVSVFGEVHDRRRTLVLDQPKDEETNLLISNVNRDFFSSQLSSDLWTGKVVTKLLFLLGFACLTLAIYWQWT